MSSSYIILASLPSFCVKKLSKLVEIWQSSDINKFAKFFWDTVYKCYCALADDGPCPSRLCGHEGHCSWQPDVQYHCICSPGHGPTAGGDVGCTPVASTSTDNFCTSSPTECVVLVVAIVAIVLLIVVVVLVKTMHVCCPRQKSRNESLTMVFSRTSDPVLELQTIETQSMTVSSPLARLYRRWQPVSGF